MGTPSDCRYVVDSSVFIAFERNQPRDIYTSLWDKLEQLLRSGVAVVPQEALVELDRGTDDLSAWVKATGAVAVTDAAVIAIVKQISQRHPGNPKCHCGCKYEDPAGRNRVRCRMAANQ